LRGPLLKKHGRKETPENEGAPSPIYQTTTGMRKRKVELLHCPGKERGGVGEVIKGKKDYRGKRSGK